MNDRFYAAPRGRLPAPLSRRARSAELLASLTVLTASLFAGMLLGWWLA